MPRVSARELQSVLGSGFDFTQPKRVGEDLLQDKQQIRAKGYDHSYFFAPERDMHTPIAKVWSADEKVQLLVSTDKPAMQLYTGNWLAEHPIALVRTTRITLASL